MTKHNEDKSLRTPAATPPQADAAVARVTTRARKSAGETAARAQRTASADRDRTQQDGTFYTADERRAMIRSEFQAEALPAVPKISGWHLCWLSQNNSHDPIAKRMRLGYVPVRADEVGEGYKDLKMKSGDFEGCVACNEMLLFKVPEDTYQAIMREFHHDMPAEEEEGLRAQLRQGDNTRDRTGKELIQEEEGFSNLVQRRQVHQFAG